MASESRMRRREMNGKRAIEKSQQQRYVSRRTKMGLNCKWLFLRAEYVCDVYFLVLCIWCYHFSLIAFATHTHKQLVLLIRFLCMRIPLSLSSISVEVYGNDSFCLVLLHFQSLVRSLLFAKKPNIKYTHKRTSTKHHHTIRITFGNTPSFHIQQSHNSATVNYMETIEMVVKATKRPTFVRMFSLGTFAIRNKYSHSLSLSFALFLAFMAVDIENCVCFYGKHVRPRIEILESQKQNNIRSAHSFIQSCT